MTELFEKVKPPFANYDIVVYFGGGLFLLPFFKRYILEPVSLDFPEFRFKVGTELASEVVSLLTLLFFIYIVGHCLAFLGSHIVEKTVDRFFGKVSSAALLSCYGRKSTRNSIVRKLFYQKTAGIINDRALFVTVIRSAFHIPVIPHYLCVWFFGFFGYYNTRLTHSMFNLARGKFSQEICTDCNINLKDKWFKPLEYYVINRYPIAVPRMYNYLIISGLFRSLCIAFLFSTWMSLYYAIHQFSDGHFLLKSLMHYDGPHAALMEYALMSFLYIFCLSSYLKFQRRYVEETIFAFIFSR